MAYADDEFWRKYRVWATRSAYRHMDAYRRVAGMAGGGLVLDLGAGQCEIGRTLTGWGAAYQPSDATPKGDEAIALDFSDLDALSAVIGEAQPTRIISVFALDVVLPTEQSSEVIRACMAHECVREVVSAGFYYNDERRHSRSVEEVGGITSYQVQARTNITGGGLVETRLEVPAASEMFGPSVVEVWRCIKREE